eukprot:TRINITY_DN8846_c0_g1_i1.p1 TRINITY_DN8846_c0_g1~~TRINITY_DN8846_c0_g1_i1.p1  ORF type:complete len:403 (+),score=43.25 TRINITY_DN8846_c0_g1_i1:146-1354(+)
MTNYSITAVTLFRIYKAIPFVYEIKMFMDWTITPTALDIMQWFKFDDIHTQMYLAKYNSSRFFVHRLGDAVTFVMKFGIGCCGLVVLVLLILGPLLLFSTFNPFTNFNPVREASVDLGFVLNNSTFFSAYRNAFVSKVESVAENGTFWDLYGRLEPLRTVERSSVQNLTMPNVSDSIWLISPPNLVNLRNYIDRTGQADLRLSYEIKRQTEGSNPTSASTSYKMDTMQTKKLYNTLGNCADCSNKRSVTCKYNESFNLNDLYISVLRLSSQNPPVPLKGYSEFNRSATLGLICDQNSIYWTLTKNSSTSGLEFITIADRSASGFLGYSIVAFYFSVVYLISKFLRLSVSGLSAQIMTSDLPRPEPIINICEGVMVARAERDLIREEVLYYCLLYTSPSPRDS